VEQYLQYNEELKVVEVKSRRKTTCTLETNDCGCIPSTDSNLETVATLCGCGSSVIDSRLITSKYGYFNHKFESNKIYLEPGTEVTEIPAQMIMAYQTNGEDSDTEVVVPEYALMAMFAGIDHFSTAFGQRTSVSRDEKREKRGSWEAAKEELLMFMFPFDLNAFAELQGIMPKW
jgi:hypothetical protein